MFRDAIIFNALRSLVLEKRFNERYKLPPDVMIIMAMNPMDSLTDSVEQLTSHFADVIDPISAGLKFSKLMDYLLNLQLVRKTNMRLTGDETSGFSEYIITEIFRDNIVDIFGFNEEDVNGEPILENVPGEMSRYYWNVGKAFAGKQAGTTVYVSPRSMETMIVNMLTGIQLLADLDNYQPTEEYEDEYLENFVKRILEKIQEGVLGVMNFVLRKYEVSAELPLYKEALVGLANEDIIKGLLDKLISIGGATAYTLDDIAKFFSDGNKDRA